MDRQDGSRPTGLACFQSHTFAIIVIIDLTPCPLRWYTCKPTQGSLCPSPIKIQYWPFLRDFSQMVNNPNWPLDDLWPRQCWCHMCDSTQWSLCPTPILIHQSMWKQWLFPKNLTNAVMTPMWPLTHFGWGHMCDRPKLIVPKSLENMLKYVDTATIFPKLWLQSQWSRWPLGDLWPFVVTCATQPQDFALTFMALLAAPVQILPAI